MNLDQMYSLANSKSGYARSSAEIYDALNEGGFRVYAAVMKEFRGFFIKFDETSLTLAPGTTEYTLPADFTQLVHLAERQVATDRWHPMAPMDLSEQLQTAQDAIGWDVSTFGEDSPFGFFGPYLDATDAQAAAALQIQKIRVSPAVDVNRFVQLVYSAKWMPIIADSSVVMLPDEGTYAMLNFAIAELRRASDDGQGENYEDKAIRHLNAFLSWARLRQIMRPRTIEPYGPGW
jgi:hypothetical protein